MASQAYRSGTLVRLVNLPELLVDFEDDTHQEMVDGNGQIGQLLRYDTGEGKSGGRVEDMPRAWLVATFNGHLVRVPEDNVRTLEVEDLPPDTDALVGPASSDQLIAKLLGDKMTDRGYCVSRIYTSAFTSRLILEACQDLSWKRVPADFEPYYLGRDSREKTALVDWDNLDTVPESLFDSGARRVDGYKSHLTRLILPAVEAVLGVRVADSTSLLIRQTFEDDDEEACYPAAAEQTVGEKESFMTLMRRKRICVLQAIGPLTGRLSLLPKDAGCEEVDIEMPPHTVVVFLTERYHYSFSCLQGRTTLFQHWLLSIGGEWNMSKQVLGDLDILARHQPGAEPPAGLRAGIRSISTYYGCDSCNKDHFWIMCNKAGGDAFVQIPVSRWDIDQYCDWEDQGRAQSKGLSYARHQGYVDGIEYFDASLFRISPSEAASMDPNQRKIMEVCYDCLHQAGHDMKGLQRKDENIGTFVGTSGTEWSAIDNREPDLVGCGQHEAILSNRLGFSLNLKGMSVTVNTACSAGLVALHLGKLQCMNTYDPVKGSFCSGINLAYSPLAFIACCNGFMLSFKGRSFTFDASADGYGRGEGLGGVYLEPLEYSNELYGLVAGSQANQDGRSASITAPNGPSQEKCIWGAFRESGVTPPEVDCFECHGTGTALGDPIEVGAFQRIYRKAERNTSLIVTSSKTNLGHLEGGAGMAGFIKCVLQACHAEGSPNIHLRQLNAHLDAAGFPAFFVDQGIVTSYDSAYSGVSSFGFGGTNAHALAYGKNISTSRGAQHMDYRKAMHSRIRNAPAPEIMMDSENPEEWETSGMPVEEDTDGKRYNIELMADSGKTIWREIVELPPIVPQEGALGIAGSFNAWKVEAMQADPKVDGLFSAKVRIGSQGFELFHFVPNLLTEPDLICYPEEVHCTKKAVDVLGPSRLEGDPTEASWCINGIPGSWYRVEFFCSALGISVTWMLRRE